MSIERTQEKEKKETEIYNNNNNTISAYFFVTIPLIGVNYTISTNKNYLMLLLLDADLF